MSFLKSTYVQIIFTLTIAMGPLYLFSEELYDPMAVYLTWQQHPESTMTVHWITPADKTDDQVLYRLPGDEAWKSFSGNHIPLPEGHAEYIIHTAEITGLEPATKYEFRPGREAQPFSFRTMPATLSEPIRFVAGGDMYHDKLEVLKNQIDRQQKTIRCLP